MWIEPSIQRHFCSKRGFLILACFLALALPGVVGAQLSGSIERYQSSDASIEALQWQLEQDAEGLTRLDASAASVTIPGLLMTLAEVQLLCNAVAFDTDQFSCLDGVIRMNVGPDREQLAITGMNFSQHQANGLIKLSGILQMDQLEADFSLEIDGEQVAGTITRISVTLPRLAQVLARDLPVSLQQGALEGQGSFTQDNDHTSVLLEFAIDHASFDSPDGLLAGADMELAGSMDLTVNNNESIFKLNLALEAGEFLADSLYLDFNQAPTLGLSIAGVMNESDLLIRSFAASDGDGLVIDGSARIDLGQGALTALEFSRMELALERVFPRYLQAVAATMGQDGLLLEGMLSGQLKLDQNQLQSLDLAFNQVWLIDDADRFGLENLNGEIHLDASDTPRESSLNWQVAQIYQVQFGDAEIRFNARTNGMVLNEGVELAVLDGALLVDEFGFSVGDQGLETFEFTGAIRPISLERLSSALEWPVMEGSLSGQVPRVSLERGVVEVGGAIRFEVFDGVVTLGDMKIERLFGVLPTLAANIDIDSLDLQQMTSVFSFGRIEGRLSGKVADLRMLDWEPVAFDLDLHSDKLRGVRRRISQRAVENLSNIGGGAAALSQTFLRVFDDFAYNKLGLSCRLSNNICTMSGVEPTSSGYYIVKGSGIPRIDIIGFSSQVDWPQLLRRLDAATRSGGATVN